jgi:hypothetical protein
MAFLFKLQTVDGAPADRVVRVRDDDADQPPVLVIEDVAG